MPYTLISVQIIHGTIKVPQKWILNVKYIYTCTTLYAKFKITKIEKTIGLIWIKSNEINLKVKLNMSYF